MRRAAVLLGTAFAIGWAAWSLFQSGSILARTDYAGTLRSAPQADITGAYLALADAEQRQPGSIAVVWNLPGDHDYQRYWLDYQYYPARVTFYRELRDAVAAGPRYILVVGLPGDRPVDPGGFSLGASQVNDAMRVTVYERSTA